MMTDRERAIVMAYTGYVMLTNGNTEKFLDYVQEKTGKRINLDDMRYKEVSDKISQSAMKDFIDLCN
jgi:predicted nucleotidyltransferase